MSDASDGEDTTTARLAVLNRAAFDVLTDGDPGLQQELVQAFMVQTAGATAAINNAARRAPLDGLIDRLHALRGAASIVAAQRLVAVLRDVEDRLRRAEIERLHASRLVLHELGLLRQELAGWRAPDQGRNQGE